MKHSVVRSAIVGLTMYLWAACPGFAQVNATVGGTVSDPSGAFIPKVNVTATNTSTGVTANTATNATGVYEFPSLQPGSYTISAATTGFQTETYKMWRSARASRFA